LLRVFGNRPEMDRLIVTSLGRRLHPLPLAEPLAAPPRGMLWRPLWSSEDPRYGGGGTPSVDADDGGWWLPAESTIVLAAVNRDSASGAPGQPRSEKEARAAWRASHDAPPG
jgi:maltooligosyltrehalose trehalohydrolase